MIDRPILILSSWSSGSPLVAGFLGECGAYLCPPFAKSLNPDQPATYESEMYRGLVAATVSEYTFAYKVDTTIFRNGFRSWYSQQTEAAEKAGARRIVLNHPLSVFLLDEICQIVDPLFVVVTRPFDKIEQTRQRQNLHAAYGQEGAKIIYERAYGYLHEHEKTYFAIPFRNFAGSSEARLQLVDYCELDVTTQQVITAFETVNHRNV